jgi:hypothetical protein
MGNGFDLGRGLYGGLKGPDRHDSRDFLFAPHRRKFGAPLRLPDEASVLHLFPPVKDQGALGSCGAFAAACARAALSKKAGHEHPDFSELWLYYETRRRFYPAEIAQDSGVYIRDVAAIVGGRGIAFEADWPYDVARFAENPPSRAYGPALWYRNVHYYRLTSLRDMLDCLAGGWPFIFGFEVHENFWTARGHGNVPMPSGAVSGGHAVCAGAFTMDPAWAGGGYVTARNSWGDFTGDGNLRFPFDLMASESVTWDVWTFHLKAEDAHPTAPS